MNRRTFLKSMAIACGVAVACPGELLKKKRHPGLDKMPYGIPYWFGKDGCLIEGEPVPDGIVFFRGIPIVYVENLSE